MKEKKYRKRIIYLYVVLLTGYFYSCESQSLQEGSTVSVFLQTLQPDIPANDLDYYYVVFQADMKGNAGLKDIPDSEYSLIGQSDCALSKNELDTLSFHFQNFEIETKGFKILVLATPSGDNETCLRDLSGNNLQIGDKFSDVCISMISDGESGHRPLSRDNYYAEHTILGKDIISNIILKINAKLERVVGQLVFDVFKTDNDIYHPTDTDAGIGSVLDRVQNIGIRTISYNLTYPLGENIPAFPSGNESINQSFETTLDAESQCLFAGDQHSEYMMGPLSKEGFPSIQGSIRIYGPYLLPSSKKSVQTYLTFTYYDTTSANGIYEKKDMTLALPASNKSLYVRENCYSITNIGITQNRIIDLDVSGGISIIPGWE